MNGYKIASIGSDIVFCVIVDVEEEFDWSEPFKRENINVKAADYLNLGHTVLTSMGVKPAYLMTYAVATAPHACAVFRKYVEHDTCDIGAQLHPWVTPPFEEEVSASNSYPSNLSADLERQKLETLIAAIKENIGCHPRIYKAGRYGLDIDRAPMLADLGFLVDTSVMPYASFKGMDGGPDFFDFPDQPFWMTDDCRLLGLPSTQGVVRPLANVAPRNLLRSIFSPSAGLLHIPGVLARLGLIERLRLTPEGFTFDHCRSLIDYNLAHGKKCFVLSFHSPSLMPGCTPYVRDAKDLKQFLDVLYFTLDYLVSKVGAKPLSALDLYARVREFHFSPSKQ
jgi:hypothetical protein